MVWKSIKSSSVYENLRNAKDGVELEYEQRLSVAADGTSSSRIC